MLRPSAVSYYPKMATTAWTCLESSYEGHKILLARLRALIPSCFSGKEMLQRGNYAKIVTAAGTCLELSYELGQTIRSRHGYYPEAVPRAATCSGSQQCSTTLWWLQLRGHAWNSTFKTQNMTCPRGTFINLRLLQWWGDDMLLALPVSDYPEVVRLQRRGHAWNYPTTL